MSQAVVSRWCHAVRPDAITQSVEGRQPADRPRLVQQQRSAGRGPDQMTSLRTTGALSHVNRPQSEFTDARVLKLRLRVRTRRMGPSFVSPVWFWTSSSKYATTTSSFPHISACNLMSAAQELGRATTTNCFWNSSPATTTSEDKDVLGSNPGPRIGNPGSDFSWFSSSPPRKCRNSPVN
jgi:hypothetical protein